MKKPARVVISESVRRRCARWGIYDRMHREWLATHTPKDEAHALRELLPLCTPAQHAEYTERLQQMERRRLVASTQRRRNAGLRRHARKLERQRKRQLAAATRTPRPRYVPRGPTTPQQDAAMLAAYLRQESGRFKEIFQ